MEEREQEALRELGAARVGEIHCITIIGQVEGHVMLPPDTKTTKYEHVLPLLAALTAFVARQFPLVLQRVALQDAGLAVPQVLLAFLHAHGPPGEEAALP